LICITSCELWPLHCNERLKFLWSSIDSVLFHHWFIFKLLAILNVNYRIFFNYSISLKPIISNINYLNTWWDEMRICLTFVKSTFQYLSNSFAVGFYLVCFRISCTVVNAPNDPCLSPPSCTYTRILVYLLCCFESV